MRVYRRVTYAEILWALGGFAQTPPVKWERLRRLYPSRLSLDEIASMIDSTPGCVRTMACKLKIKRVA